MTHFQMLIGCMIVVVAVMAAWAFRVSNTPIMAKIALSLALIALACAAPFVQYQARAMPIETTIGALPQCIDVLALAPAGPSVDLWLKDSARITRLPLDPGLTAVLIKVREALQSGEPFVRLCKGGSAANASAAGVGSQGNLAQDDSKMHIDESLFLNHVKD